MEETMPTNIIPLAPHKPAYHYKMYRTCKIYCYLHHITYHVYRIPFNIKLTVWHLRTSYNKCSFNQQIQLFHPLSLFFTCHKQTDLWNSSALFTTPSKSFYIWQMKPDCIHTCAVPCWSCWQPPLHLFAQARGELIHHVYAGKHDEGLCCPGGHKPWCSPSSPGVTLQYAIPINQATRCNNFLSLLFDVYLAAQHVSGVLTPIIRSSTTAVAASGFTVGAWR